MHYIFSISLIQLKFLSFKVIIQILILLGRLLEFAVNAPNWQKFEVKWLLHFDTID